MACATLVASVGPACAGYNIWCAMQGHRLETAETAAFKYEKARKKDAPVGWEAFNQRTKAEAYDKRADKIAVDLVVRCQGSCQGCCRSS